MTSKEQTPTFSKSAEALDTILDRFRGDSLSLEDALELFEKGVGHLKVCQTKLGDARGKVEELVKTMQADGEAATRPFDLGC